MGIQTAIEMGIELENLSLIEEYERAYLVYAVNSKNEIVKTYKMQLDADSEQHAIDLTISQFPKTFKLHSGIELKAEPRLDKAKVERFKANNPILFED